MHNYSFTYVLFQNQFSDDKRYQCRICDKRFIQIGTIKRHCETHETEGANIDHLIIRLDESLKVSEGMAVFKPLQSPFFMKKQA